MFEHDTSKRSILFTTSVLCVLLIAGFCIRLINLGEPGFGTDEPLHVYSAQSILETGEPTLPSGTAYTRALLFTRLVALSLKLLGNNEFAARFPSVIFGTLTIILIFVIAKQFFGTTVGLLSALFVAFSPFEIAWSRECRMYSMYQFFFLFGLFAFYHGFENVKSAEQSRLNLSACRQSTRLSTTIFHNWGLSWKWIIFSVVLLYVSFSLHGLTAIYGVSLLCYLVLMSLTLLFSKKYGEFIRSKYLFFFCVITVSGTLGLFLIPGILQFAKNYFLYRPEWASGYPFNPLYYLTFLSSSAAFPTWAFFILGSIQIVTRKHKPGIYTMVCASVPLTILSLNPHVRVPRYIFNIYPLIILIASYSMATFLDSESKVLSGLLRISRVFKYRTLISGCLLSVALLAMSPSVIYHGYQNIADYYDETRNTLGMTHRNWGDACTYVSNYSKPGDIVITTEPLSASYYRCDNVDYCLRRSIDGFGVFTLSNTKFITDLDTLKVVLSRHPRGWIVIDSDRLNSDNLIPEGIREFILKNLSYKIIEPHGTILVFWWERCDF